MKGMRRRGAGWVAVLATLSLFLHSFVVGFAGGAMASAGQLDTLGAVICTGHGAVPADPGQPADSSHLPDCCLIGCSLLGGYAVAGPVAPAVPVPEGRARDVAPLPETYRAPLGTFERSPLNPRAPPLAG